jgi:methyl-accepting chemotaxis protein
MKDNLPKRKPLPESNQIRLGFVIIAIVFLVMVSLFVEFNIYKLTEVILPKITSLGISDLVMQVYYMIMVRTWLLIVMVAVLAIYLPIHLSRRFLGARYRIEKEILEHISSGNLMHEFNVREKDEMASTANALNTMVDSLKTKVRDVEDFRKDAEKELDSCLVLMKGELTEEKKKQVIAHLESLADKNRKIPYLA